MSLTWTTDEQGMLDELRKVGVKIGTVINEPWAYDCGLIDSLVDDKDACLYPGIGIEITRSLCTMLTIPCQFVRLDYSTNMTKDSASVDSYKLDYQEWLKSEIVGGDIDTTLPIIVETNSNLDKQLLDFTLPLFYMDGGLLVRKTMAASGQLMMKPFHLNVWIALGAILLLVTAVDICCRVLIARVTRTKDYNISASVIISFGIITGRSVDVDVPLWSRRVIYAITGIVSIVIAASYSAFLVSTRVSTNVYIPFSNLDQLANALESGKYKLFVDQYSSHFFTMIDSSPLPIFMRLKEIFKQPGKNPELVSNMTQKIQEIGRSQENIVLYSSQFVLRATAKGNCNITIIPLTELSDRGSFAFRKKNYPYSSLFFKATISFKDKGDFYEQTELKYRFSRPCAPAAGVAGAEGVDLGSLAELFYFVLIGLFVSALFFGLELLFGTSNEIPRKKLSSDRQMAMTAGDFAFMQSYRQPKNGFSNQINGDAYGRDYPTVGRGVNFDPKGPTMLEDDVFKSFWVFGETDRWHVPDQRVVYRRRSSAVQSRKRNGSF